MLGHLPADASLRVGLIVLREVSLVNDFDLLSLEPVALDYESCHV